MSYSSKSKDGSVDIESRSSVSSASRSDSHAEKGVIAGYDDGMEALFNPPPKSKTREQVSYWTPLVLYLGLLAYAIAAMVMVSTHDNGTLKPEDPDFRSAKDGVVILVIALLLLAHFIFNRWVKEPFLKAYLPFYANLHDKITPKIRSICRYTMIACYVIVLVVVGVIFAIVEPKQADPPKEAEPTRLIALAGIAFLLLASWAISKYKMKVNLRILFAALWVQLILGLLILRTAPVRAFTQWLSDIVTTFLGFIHAGSSFVWGADPVVTKAVLDGTGALVTMSAPSYTLSYFAHVVLPTIIFFGATVSLMYYIGLIQPVIRTLAFIYRHSIGSSTSTSINSAANIFLGMTEAPLLIKPLVVNMTASELHAVMTGGFATVAGSVLGAYISFGVPPQSLIAASFMNAPCALGISNLVWAEIGVPADSDKQAIKTALDGAASGCANVIDAFATGTANAIMLAVNIGAMLVTFLSALDLIDTLLNWLCWMVDVRGPGGSDVNLQLVIGYCLMPLVFIMGVPWKDAQKVGSIIGTKIILNEFIAFVDLGIEWKIFDGCTQGNPISVVTPEQCANALSRNALTIATYSVCGFANVGSLGIQLGGLSPMVGERRAKVLPMLVVRAMVAGTIASFMSACIAGLIEDFTTNVSIVYPIA